MAKILHKQKDNKKKVTIITNGTSDTVQAYNHLPKHIIPKKKIHIQ